MAHRGRLNVLHDTLHKPAAEIFREFADVDPEQYRGRGDVKYHMGYSSDRMTSSGNKVHLSLSFNPSHLEFVGPVVLGRTRAKQDRRGDKQGVKALALLIHGDSAFTGQGVTQEVFNFSELPGYTVGGTVHIVLNNQIGFTTTPEEARTSQYSTDVARMLQVPIFHVNGEDPEAAAQVIKLAMDFRFTFRKDVVIDMYCFRRHGHNEGDDPSYTQPLMYELIRSKQSCRAAYVENLLRLGEVTAEEAAEIVEASRARLEAGLVESKNDAYELRGAAAGAGLWSPYRGGPDGESEDVDTGVPRDELASLLDGLTCVPEGFNTHKKIERLFRSRREMARGNTPLDWGAAEALAFATLAKSGARIRLSGQDVERGTFGHRHSVLHDTKTGESYVPLAHVSDEQAPFEVYNSPLSETSVLGFDYGYSLDYPDGLIIWEAQFGDFANGAQVIIDQFISSSEDKWRRLTSIVMLLPHGFEGQGPEHSSARLERFLMMSAEDNMQIVNPTTPAQIFHCLRRQVVRPWRKPLVVMSPKSLLRNPLAVSSLDDLATGRYQRVIPDDSVDPKAVWRVLLCSGKIYYDLLAARDEAGMKDVALIRLEQYYPLPLEQLGCVLAPYPKKAPVIWVQEEPVNMGAWPFLRLRLSDWMQGRRSHALACFSRPESASPATGSAAMHKIEQKELIERALVASDE
jgi:2-oxoglutarate dehydrogenase E1 component